MGVITDWLLRNNTIKEDEIVLYEYAVKNLILIMIPFSLSVIIGAVLGVPFQSLGFEIILLVSKKYLGGVHLSSGIVCMAISTALLILSDIIIACNIEPNLFLVPVMLFMLNAWLQSPIESINKPLYNEERKRYTKMSRVIIVILLLTYLITMFFSYKQVELCVACVIIVIGITQMPVYFKS